MTAKTLCLSCKRHTGNNDVRKEMSKRNQSMMKSTCVDCGKRKSYTLKKGEGNGLEALIRPFLNQADQKRYDQVQQQGSLNVIGKTL